MVMVVLEYALGVLILCSILCLLAYWLKVLDKGGSASAFVIGAIIGIFGGILWLILLLFFLITSFGATKYKYALKEAMGVHEGRRGERHVKNVVANGLAPTIIALLSYEEFHIIEDKWMAEIAFVAAISVAAADTAASELGVLSDKVYLITDLKTRVRAGTSGGVALLGQFWAITEACYTAIMGWFMLYYIPETFLNQDIATVSAGSPLYAHALVMIPLIIGFFGCQIDSVLGATLEQKGWLSNNGVNFSSTSLGGLIAWLLIPLVVLS
jgi:uncharacterized protein (TIGR00297 family)